MEGWQSGNAAPWKGVVGNGAGVRFPHLPPYKNCPLEENGQIKLHIEIHLIYSLIINHGSDFFITFRNFI